MHDVKNGNMSNSCKKTLITMLWFSTKKYNHISIKAFTIFHALLHSSHNPHVFKKCESESLRNQIQKDT